MMKRYFIIISQHYDGTYNESSKYEKSKTKTPAVPRKLQLTDQSLKFNISTKLRIKPKQSALQAQNELSGTLISQKTMNDKTNT
jgi:hypothetical protein